MCDRLTDPVRLREYRLRILRAQAARLMMDLDEVGLNEAAAHISMGIGAMDRAALAETGAPGLGLLH